MKLRRPRTHSPQSKARHDLALFFKYLLRDAPDGTWFQFACAVRRQGDSVLVSHEQLAPLPVVPTEDGKP